MIQKVRIEANPPYTKIYADGKEINGVKRFSVKQDVCMELPVLKLELVAAEIEFDGTVVTEIEESAP